MVDSWGQKPTTLSDGIDLVGTRSLAFGGVLELTLLGTKKATVRGYFSDLKSAVSELSALLSTLVPEGIYITLNPISPDLLARAVNRFEPYAKTRAGDSDVLRRLWFPVDVDPVRPSGISASGDELTLALTRTDAVLAWLTNEHGWPQPVRSGGGNSGHGLYAIDEPNDAATGTLIKSVYAVIAERFSDEEVVVDKAVSNAARIWTVYGSLKRKGDSTEDRPHRRSWIADVPQPLTLVTREQLESVAAPMTPPRPRRQRSTNSHIGHTAVLDMAAEFITRGWYLQQLSRGHHAVTCPWVSEHSGQSGLSETVLFEPREPGGFWGFQCQHAHCSDRTIRDVWALIRPRADFPEAAENADTSPRAAEGVKRTVHLTPASTIRVRPVRWLWTDRLAVGTLCLLGGREGVGKTIWAYTFAAAVSRGRLPGVYQGIPRSVIVAATEDSWEHTIVPRLMAAGADLQRVLRIDVATSGSMEAPLSFPRDVVGLERVLQKAEASLIILDPLLSRLDTALDTHKDAEVRVALEPLVKLASDADACVLGLIHVNKSASTDALTLLMGSRAFTAVARAVLFVMVHPEDEMKRLLGQVKNNLGRTDLETLVFRIEDVFVANTDEGPVRTGRLVWLPSSNQPIGNFIRGAVTRPFNAIPVRITTVDDWLQEFLTARGGTCASDEVRVEATSAGYSEDTLKRARRRLGVASKGHGFPRRTVWSLPNRADAPSGETCGTAPTAPTAPQSVQSGELGQSDATSPVPYAAKVRRR